MRFIDETSDTMYIDELCKKLLNGKCDSSEIYLNDDNKKVTIEFEITDLIRANNFINILKYDHDGNIAKTFGIKMTECMVIKEPSPIITSEDRFYDDYQRERYENILG